MNVDGPSPWTAIPRGWPFKRVYYGWAIVIATFVISFGEVPVFGPVLGVFILPMQEDLGWSRATIALGFTIGSISGSVTTFIIGSLLDRYGARIIVVSTGIVITIAMLGLAMMDQLWQFWTFSASVEVRPWQASRWAPQYPSQTGSSENEVEL